MKKAIIYTRAKVDLSDCNLMSITVQAEACKKYADKFDMKVAGLITDIIPIGAERRCVGWDAIVNVKKPYFDFIIVYDYARIGRNVPKLIRQRTKIGRAHV